MITKPIIIAFEGIDGCGKTSIINHIIKGNYCQDSNLKLLDHIGHRYYFTDKKYFQLLINNFFLVKEANCFNKYAILCWWCARFRNKEEMYALHDSTPLIFYDRYYDSTYIYGDLENDIIAAEYNYDKTKFLTPTVTFYLKTDPEVALSRKLDRIDNDVCKTIYDNNVDLAKIYSDRYDSLFLKDNKYTKDRSICIIDANQSIEYIINDVLNRLLSEL